MLISQRIYLGSERITHPPVARASWHLFGILCLPLFLSFSLSLFPSFVCLFLSVFITSFGSKTRALVFLRTPKRKPRKQVLLEGTNGCSLFLRVPCYFGNQKGTTILGTKSQF